MKTETTAPAHKPNTFISYSEDGMRNGSVYRVTGRKREPYAMYNLGDFIGFTNEIPDDYTFAMRYKDCKFILPACFR